MPGEDPDVASLRVRRYVVRTGRLSRAKLEPPTPLLVGDFVALALVYWVLAGVVGGVPGLALEGFQFSPVSALSSPALPWAQGCTGGFERDEGISAAVGSLTPAVWQRLGYPIASGYTRTEA